MAVTDKKSLLDRVTAIIGDDKNDEAISLMEDLTDTFDDYDEKVRDQTDWKTKYEENDKNWRDKYVSRFKVGVVPDEDEDDKDEPAQITRFEDLFTEVKKEK